MCKRCRELDHLLPIGRVRDSEKGAHQRESIKPKGLLPNRNVRLHGGRLLCRSRIQPRREAAVKLPVQSKTDLVNPPLEHGHGKALAVALRYRFLFMA